ncbi:UNVERIFIED_CONTAM: hypothetical protein Slati_0871300 [Sesamum latifolium]|uniref:DUF4283 domain-containing protein n=1 Tax=Sesamum latifolium TaxID=2727402 RepID=A0AAW2XSP2_9LAMI
MVLCKLKHTQLPVWVKLRHLPVELWNTDGLSTVASGIGRPLYLDAITCACTRLNFACVCIMLDISSTLPKHIVIMVPKEEGSESACKVDVEYEWLPPKCTTCMSLGHATRMCPTMKLKQHAVSVYVPKVDATKKVPEWRETVQEGGPGSSADLPAGHWLAGARPCPRACEQEPTCVLPGQPASVRAAGARAVRRIWGSRPVG